MQATSELPLKRALKSCSGACTKRKQSAEHWKIWPAAMTSRRAHCAASELSSAVLEGRLMKFVEHRFRTNGMIPILYWRICHEVVQAGFDPTSLLFACAIHCASRVFRSYGPIRRTITGFARQTVPQRVAATCGADCPLPGRPRCSDPGRFYLSDRDCRGGPLDATAFRPQR